MMSSKLSVGLLAVSLCSLSAVGCGNSSPADSGTDASTLYTRLGGHTGIATAVDAIVAQEVMDPDIASYFFAQTAATTPAGHPTLAQLKSCLVNQLGNAAGGPEAYPGTPADNMGFQCRDMMTAHTGLGIPGGTFDHFVTIAAGVLTTAGVSSADVATVGGVLNSTRTAIAQDTTRDAGPYIAPGGGDAGDGG